MDFQRLLAVLRLIESASIDYMVTDSIASILYGTPRLTQDMDVVIMLSESSAGAFLKLFDPDEYYCPPEEAIREALRRGNKGHLNIIDQSTGFKVDLYPAGNDPFAQWGLAHRRKVELVEGEEVWVAPPEYVIVMKLDYFREGGSQKHLADIEGMLAVSREDIDLSELERWIAVRDLTTQWKIVRQSNV